MNFPEWPLYLLAAIQAGKYFVRFRQERNYILLGKGLIWSMLAGVYLWAQLTQSDILTVRDVVRFGICVWMLADLTFFTIQILLDRKYGKLNDHR